MVPPPACQGGVERQGSSYVYLLKSVGKDTWYLGWTTDLKRRLEEHNAGDSRYTKSKGPWKLVSYEVYANPEEAKRRERALKHSSRMLTFFKKRALNVFRTTNGGPRQVRG